MRLTFTYSVALSAMLCTSFSVLATPNLPPETEAKAVAKAQLDDVQILGFQSWKAQKIDEAAKNLSNIEAAARAENSKASPKNNTPKKPNQKLQEAKMNFEIARELSVNDYFVLYLSQFQSRQALAEAAKKLSSDEMAELMQAFQRSLGALSSSDSPTQISRLNQPEDKK